jgi:hypothetical protein
MLTALKEAAEWSFLLLTTMIHLFTILPRD